MARNPDDLTATKIRDRPIDDQDTVVEDAPDTLDEESLSGPYQYYQSSPDQDDEETRRIVKSAVALLLGQTEPKK